LNINESINESIKNEFILYFTSHYMIIGIAGKMGCGKDYICNNVIIPLL